MSNIPNNNCITAFIHCTHCIEELHDPSKPIEMSPRDYAQLEVGFTPQGLQVWCKRHDCNVMHIDYEGKSPFPANTTAAE